MRRRLVKGRICILSVVVVTCYLFTLARCGESRFVDRQLVAESIIVRHMKSILDPSLPVRVYGPMRSTHSAFHGVVMTSLGGT